jgi:hypothetical protein
VILDQHQVLGWFRVGELNNLELAANKDAEVTKPKN